MWLLISILTVGLVSVVIASWILQISTRIICGDAIDFRDAFKVALVGVILGIGIDFLFIGEDSVPSYLLAMLISFAVWTLAIFLLVRISFVQAMLVAVVVKVLGLVVSLLLTAYFFAKFNPA